mmetsp:Transcript_7651/g.19615  ORF Transcript_7651/g.19615 Transcript_7651/m.19615 type:complete len:217 (+) Transcript_7651:347-997(+)
MWWNHKIVKNPARQHPTAEEERILRMSRRDQKSAGWHPPSAVPPLIPPLDATVDSKYCARMSAPPKHRATKGHWEVNGLVPPANLVKKDGPIIMALATMRNTPTAHTSNSLSGSLPSPAAGDAAKRCEAWSAADEAGCRRDCCTCLLSRALLTPFGPPQSPARWIREAAVAGSLCVSALEGTTEAASSAAVTPPANPVFLDQGGHILNRRGMFPSM